MVPKPSKRVVINESGSMKVEDAKCSIDAEVSNGNNCIEMGVAADIEDTLEIIRYCTEKKGIVVCIRITGYMSEYMDDTEVSKMVAAGAGEFKLILESYDVGMENMIDQIKLSKIPFVFENIIKEGGQRKIVEFSKWAVRQKPVIVSFSTRSGLDILIVEEQLNEAIPILLEGGIGVNLYHYPMCRISEPFRMCVCNCLQEKFDPNRDSDSVTPKSYKKYYDVGSGASNLLEIKGAPCQDCALHNICGGAHRGLICSKKDLALLIPQKEPVDTPNDIYYYRRQNRICIQDRFPKQKGKCVAVIADKNNCSYIPIFLYMMYVLFPDIETKVFARYDDHKTLRDILDPHVAHGYYNSCVIDVNADLIEYSDAPEITNALRFIVFDKYLRDYKEVEFTDPAVFTAIKINNEAFYEKYLIKKKWWELTADSREKLKDHVKTLKSERPNYSDIIFEDINKDETIRNHAEKSITWHEEVARVFNTIKTDKNLCTIVEKCAQLNSLIELYMKHMQKLPEKLSRGIKTVRVITKPARRHDREWGCWLKDRKPRKVIPDIPEKLEHYEGKLLIYTMCDEVYQWYIPLFFYSLRLSYPELSALVYITGKADLAMLELCGPDKDKVKEIELPKAGGSFSAAYRYLVEPEGIRDYDYVLITDSDMLHYREKKISIIDAHMALLHKNKTICYENHIVERKGGSPRLRGVHFVTRNWWGATEAARAQERGALEKKETIPWDYDEYMLGRIVTKSKLPLPPFKQRLAMNWRFHAIHIGHWRHAKDKPFPGIKITDHTRRIVADPEFVRIATECDKHLNVIGKVIRLWQKLLR